MRRLKRAGWVMLAVGFGLAVTFVVHQLPPAAPAKASSVAVAADADVVPAEPALAIAADDRGLPPIARPESVPAVTLEAVPTPAIAPTMAPPERDRFEPPPRPEPLPAVPPPGSGQPGLPLAIMVENAPDARPQSGLSAADVVFEAMAEGGISRFMAVYFGGEAPVVGPVRSARHYFVNYAAELGASVVHIGASPQGYDWLRASGLRTLDETYGQPGFWRSRARLAPHNAYTSLAGARDALSGLAPPTPAGWGGFTFKAPELRYEGPAAPRLALDFQPWGYRVEYRYDPVTNRYLRFMDGAPHLDAETHAQLQAASVAVLRVNAWVVDSEGRLDMTQVGSGPAVYFLDGVAFEGTWSKASPYDVTRFLDRVGNPVRFNPGPTWIQIIQPESKVSY